MSSITFNERSVVFIAKFKVRSIIRLLQVREMLVVVPDRKRGLQKANTFVSWKQYDYTAINFVRGYVREHMNSLAG